jgi:diguanylate cyclase (GGDEF)-like protein/PAS domain S-box-containing protein
VLNWTLFDAVFNAVLVVDLRGTIRFANRQVAELFGYSPQEITGQAISSFIPQRLRWQSVVQTLRAKRGNEETPIYEDRIQQMRLKDGSRVDLDLRIAPATRKGFDILLVAIRQSSTRTLDNQQLHLQSSALSATANGVVITDRRGQVLWANEAFASQIGQTASKLPGKPSPLFHSTEANEGLPRKVWRAVNNGHLWSGEVSYQRQDGTRFTWQATITPMRDENESVTGHVAIIQDISQRKSIEQSRQRQLRDLQLLHRMASMAATTRQIEELLGQGTWLIAESITLDYLYVGTVSEEGNRLHLNGWAREGQAVRKSRAIAQSGIVGHVLRTERVVRHNDLGQRALPEDSNQRTMSADMRSVLCVPMKAGDRIVGVINAERRLSAGFGGADEKLFVTLANQLAAALESARLFNEAHRLAIIDPLTDTYNRRHFFDITKREMERSKRHDRELSLLMIDVDHFKRINDRFGHPVGDEALCTLAFLGKKMLRDSDILGRLGGEEFAVLLPETDQEAAHLAADRLRESIAQARVSSAMGEVTLTVSIGVATLDQRCKDVSMLFSRADQALYAAKIAGRDQVHCWSRDFSYRIPAATEQQAG